MYQQQHASSVIQSSSLCPHSKAYEPEARLTPAKGLFLSIPCEATESTKAKSQPTPRRSLDESDKERKQCPPRNERTNERTRPMQEGSCRSLSGATHPASPKSCLGSARWKVSQERAGTHKQGVNTRIAPHHAGRSDERTSKPSRQLVPARPSSNDHATLRSVRPPTLATSSPFPLLPLRGLAPGPDSESPATCAERLASRLSPLDHIVVASAQGESELADRRPLASQSNSISDDQLVVGGFRDSQTSPWKHSRSSTLFWP